MSERIPVTKLVVYCHGYNGSPESEKVRRLRAACAEIGAETFSFPVDVDPTKALPFLTAAVDGLLLSDMHNDVRLVFVGTSLGAWFAGSLGALYDLPAVLVNPSNDPYISLEKYGVPEEIRAKYVNEVPIWRTVAFLAKDDPVIDHGDFIARMDKLGAEYNVVEGESHRFDGKGWDLVIDRVKEILNH